MQFYLHVCTIVPISEEIMYSYTYNIIVVSVVLSNAIASGQVQFYNYVHLHNRKALFSVKKKKYVKKLCQIEFRHK